MDRNLPYCFVFNDEDTMKEIYLHFRSFKTMIYFPQEENDINHDDETSQILFIGINHFLNNKKDNDENSKKLSTLLQGRIVIVCEILFWDPREFLFILEKIQQKSNDMQTILLKRTMDEIIWKWLEKSMDRK